MKLNLNLIMTLVILSGLSSQARANALWGLFKDDKSTPEAEYNPYTTEPKSLKSINDMMTSITQLTGKISNSKALCGEKIEFGTSKDDQFAIKLIRSNAETGEEESVIKPDSEFSIGRQDISTEDSLEILKIVLHFPGAALKSIACTYSKEKF